jgi:hypothetical protein
LRERNKEKMSSDKRQELHDSRPIQPSSTTTTTSNNVVYAVPVYSAPTSTIGGGAAPGSAAGFDSTPTIVVTNGQQQHQQTVFHAVPQATIVGVVQTNYFGSQPQRVICQFCGADVITGVRVTVRSNEP